MSQVVIVGAGPAGASLAYLLARGGVRTTLVERRRDFSREFRGEVLVPGGMDALAQMGLTEELARLPHQDIDHFQAWLDGKRILRLDAAEALAEGVSLPRASAISQPALLEMLVGKAGQYPEFQFFDGATVTSTIRSHGRISGLNLRRDGEQLQLDCDLLIGADGRNSIVRREAGFVASPVNPPMDAVWCKLPRPVDWRGMRVYAGHGHLLIAYRSWDDQLQLAWVILKGTFKDLRERGEANWIEEMAQHVDVDFAAHLRARSGEVSKPFLLEAVSDRVESWSVPGCLVIGDAAHTMSPVGAQGINIALRDAIVAANHLIPVLSGPVTDQASLDRVLGQLEAERMLEVAPIQALQARPPRLMLRTGWLGELARSFVARLIQTPWIARRLARQVEPFINGVTEVRLND